MARNAQHILGIWRNMFVAVLNRVDSLGASRIGEGLLRLERSSTTGVGLLVVVAPRSPTPTSEVRNQLAAATRAVAGLKGVAVVYEEKGLQASIVRSVVAGIAFISRPSVPNRFFSSLGEAATWIDPLVHGSTSDSAALVQAVGLIRCDPQRPPDGVRVISGKGDPK